MVCPGKTLVCPIKDIFITITFYVHLKVFGKYVADNDIDHKLHNKNIHQDIYNKSYAYLVVLFAMLNLV